MQLFVVFGAILKDTHTSITAVCEYHYDESPKLVVGTKSNATNMLCLFDIATNKVIKAVEMEYRVNSSFIIAWSIVSKALKSSFASLGTRYHDIAECSFY